MAQFLASRAAELLAFAAKLGLGFAVRLVGFGLFLAWLAMVCTVSWNVGWLFGPMLYRILY